MRDTYNVIMEVEGTAEKQKIGLHYLPRKGDDLVINFYDEEIIRYRVKSVMAEMYMVRSRAVYPVPLETTYRVIVEEMSS